VAARVEVGQPALQLDHEQIIRVGLGFIQDRLAGRAVNPSESDLGDHTDALRHWNEPVRACHERGGPRRQRALFSRSVSLE